MTVFNPTVWMPLLVPFADCHVAKDSKYLSELDLEEWSDEFYDWEIDPYNGIIDYLTKPGELLMTDSKGDCEDYAFFAASVICSRGDGPVKIAWLYKFDPYTGHAIAGHDGKTYTSGEIVDKDMDSWINDHNYNRLVTRVVG